MVAHAAEVDVTGAEIVRTIEANSCVMVDPAVTAGALFLKIRSGLRSNPVAGGGSRVYAGSSGLNVKAKGDSNGGRAIVTS